MHTMLIRPTQEELASFGAPDFVIYNAGAFPANRLTNGMGSTTSIDLSLEDKELVILGTEYAGEMKKGVFTVANYFAPKRGVLSMHCSATADKKTGVSSLLFGLSGTGRRHFQPIPNAISSAMTSTAGAMTASSTSKAAVTRKRSTSLPKTSPTFSKRCVSARCWKTWCSMRITTWTTPTRASRKTREAPIRSSSSTTRRSPGRRSSNGCHLPHVRRIRVLPPVSALSPSHAMYHFISGYTAKVAGTEMGVTEPQATFSPCFGGPFLVWHPSKYAELLAEKMRKHNARVWLVNTGWGGGGYGMGKRISLKNTRAIIDAIHGGSLAKAKTERDPVFGFDVVTECPNVPSEILSPRECLGRQNRLRRHGEEARRASSTRTSRPTQPALVPR